jgi:CO/xanthine dehydrogenase Mo-binding subunit
MARQHGIDYTPPDLLAKFTGKARYAEDFRADGMLFTKLLLSPMPHARIRNIDTSAAMAMEGVLAVLTADDVPGSDDPLRETCLVHEAFYEGQPIAAVAATSELIAANAVEKLKVDYEPLPFAIDPLESLKPGGANARVEGNILKRERTEDGMKTTVEELKWTDEDFRNAAPDMLPLGEHQNEWVIGDVDAAFAEAEVIIHDTMHHQSVTHHPMEPRTCMSYWRNGKLYSHCSTQSVAVTQSAFAAQMGIDRSDLVIISEFTGGGFGSKIAGTVNMAISALLSKKLDGRPVMQRVTRYEETYYGRARPALIGNIKLGFRKDGRLLAADMLVVQDNGPYGSQSDVRSAGNVVSLSYQPINMRYRTVSIFTNTPPCSAQRAPGGAQITAMVEPLIDRAAKELGIDRMQIRRINAPNGESKFGPRQQGLTSARVSEAMDKMETLVNWQEKAKLSGRREGTKVTGVGLALSSYVAGTSGYDGLMILRPDGRLTIHTGVGNLGTHSYADTARTACEVLDYPWDKVEMVWGNTSKGLPHTAVQAGSMTTFSATRAHHAAASDMKLKLQQIAARDLGGKPSDYSVGGERVYRRGARGTGMSFAKAAERAIALGGSFSGQEMAEDLNGMTKAAVALLAGQGLIGAAKDNYEHKGSVYSFVVGFAEVEIDVETGVLRIVDYAAVTDCGKVMNPRSLIAQLHGGGIQGFGMARSQKWIYDVQWGVPFAHRFYTARPPSILDVPLEMKGDYVDIPDPQTPVGSKGIGEPPVGAGEAAVVCAIQDALGEVSFKRTPIMTDMILNTLEGNPQPVGTLRAHA